MSRRRFQLVTMSVLIGCGATSCSAPTSPATLALNGPWTSGHACLAFGLDLKWTDADVHGSGTYRTDIGPTNCNVSPLLIASGTSVLDARRTSPTSISGTITFDGRTRAAFSATLTTGGGARMAGSVVTPDGDTTAVTLIEGLVP